MYWVIGLLLIVFLGRVQAQETPASTLELENESFEKTYEHAIVKFNTDTKDFPSWEALQTEVFAHMLQGTMGRCYERTTSSLQPVQITRVLWQKATGDGWQKTSGKGWRRYDKATRTYIEYRVNPKAGLLFRTESVKMLFFPPQTKKLCEFPL